MKPNYNCSQDELYAGEAICINSYEAEQAQFANEKPKYTMPYVATLRAELQAARDLPDMTQRDSANKGRRIVLIRKIKAPEESMEPAEGEKNFGRVRSYINTAYAGDKVLREARLAEAGFNEYDKVMSMNWEKVESFLNKTKLFVNEYETELLADDNMPPTFKAAYDTFVTGLMTDITTFLDEQENVEQMTQTKIMANNALHKKMNELRADGQNIFKKNIAKRDQFVWIKILEEVTPPGAAGLRGTVKDFVSLLPIVGAVIEMQMQESLPVTFATDAQGSFYSGNLPVGTYSLKLSKGGFTTLETQVEIKTGTTSFKHFKLSTGGGTMVVVEGEAGIYGIDNVPVPNGVNDDTWVTLEGLGTQFKYYAGDTEHGEQTGTGALYANDGAPIEMKWSVIVSQIGLGGVHAFFNVKNTGEIDGDWRVTFVIA